VLALWVAGGLGWWAVAAWRIGRFRGLLRFASPAPPALQERAQRLARRLGLVRCPDVRLVPAAVSPLLWALGGTSRLLLPAGLWPRLTPEQQETLLAHELAHLRRRDHWVRRLELLVTGLYWWHPVVWWARRQLREAEEQCCDAWVVWALPGAAPAYATALVETVAFLSRARPALPLAASGIGHIHTLKRRLTMILREPPPRALSGAGLLAVLGLGALLLPLLPAPAQEPAKTETPDQPAAAKKAEPGTAPKTETLPATSRTTREKLATAPERNGKPESSGTKKPATTASGPADRSGHVEALRDEIELLEAQLAVKEAELKAAEVALALAKHTLARVENLRTQAAISQEEVEAARGKVATLEAAALIKRAELREPQVRLQQARRRLARLQGPVEKSGRANTRTEPAGDKNRQSDLEKKLDAILKEVENLRKQNRPSGPTGGEKRS
jgi:beta-lactamase regulating signal transducer with metallopeptidase domain